MSRNLLALLAPPVAVCRFGCAECMAAPVAVCWLAGIIALGAGALITPLGGGEGVSWKIVAVGLALWATGSLWSLLATRSSLDQPCPRPGSR